MENNKDLIHKITLLKALDKDISENKSIDVPEGYDLVRRKVKKQSRKTGMHKLFYRAAAILLLPLLISTFTLLYLYSGQRTDFLQPDSPFIEVTAAPGTVIKTELPDHSHVWLNSGSTLRYPAQFVSGKRTVELTGEAFFEVNADPEYPFEVGIGDEIKIIARGTAFNINAYQEDDIYETVLQEGILEVMYGDNQASMQPNDIVYLDKSTNHLIKSGINIDEKTGWKDGLLIFRNTPIEEVFKRLSRRYNVEIVLHKNTVIDYGIRATFSSETLIQILDVLKMAAPITWSIREIRQNNDLSYPKQHIDVWIN